MTCVHCKKLIRDFGGQWAHEVGPGSYLNRCQAAVPYGHEAHPAEVECPAWCLGSVENPCTHKD